MASSLTSPSDTMIKDAIQEIAIGNEKLEDRLERDVTEVCKCLDENFARPFFHTIIKSQLQKNLSDIYWCLKLHLAFHLGPERALQHEKLKQFGYDVLELTEEQLNDLPDETHAIDPGSKVLEMVSMHYFQPTCLEQFGEGGRGQYQTYHVFKHRIQQKGNTIRPSFLSLTHRLGKGKG